MDQAVAHAPVAVGGVDLVERTAREEQEDAEYALTRADWERMRRGG